MEPIDLNTLAANAARVYQEGDFEHAARLFGEVAEAYVAQGKPLDAAEMKNNQSVAFLQSGDALSSLDAALGTAEIFHEANDFRREGMAFGNQASALAALGRMDEAAGAYKLAADALQKAGDDQLYASVMQALAGLQLRRGKMMDALLSMQVGLAAIKNPTLKEKILRGMLRFRV